MIAFVFKHWRIAGALSLVGAMIGFTAWIDHTAAARTRDQIEAARARLQVQIRDEVRRSEQQLAGAISELASDYERGRTVIERTRTIIQPTVTREITLEPRLSDPASGLTPGLLAAVNRARATGACTAAAPGRIVCPLPEPAAVADDDDRRAGDEGH